MPRSFPLMAGTPQKTFNLEWPETQNVLYRKIRGGSTRISVSGFVLMSYLRIHQLRRRTQRRILRLFLLSIGHVPGCYCQELARLIYQLANWMEGFYIDTSYVRAYNAIQTSQAYCQAYPQISILCCLLCLVEHLPCFLGLYHSQPRSQIAVQVLASTVTVPASTGHLALEHE